MLNKIMFSFVNFIVSLTPSAKRENELNRIVKLKELELAYMQGKVDEFPAFKYKCLKDANFLEGHNSVLTDPKRLAKNKQSIEEHRKRVADQEVLVEYYKNKIEALKYEINHPEGSWYVSESNRKYSNDEMFVKY